MNFSKSFLSPQTHDAMIRSMPNLLTVDSRSSIGLISLCVVLQVRKAAYQSLGPFISTFYDPDSYSSPEDYLGDKESPEQLLENDNAYQYEGQNKSSDNSNTTGESPALSGAYYNSDGKSSPTDVKVECRSCACHMDSAVKVNVNNIRVTGISRIQLVQLLENPTASSG